MILSLVDTIIRMSILKLALLNRHNVLQLIVVKTLLLIINKSSQISIVLSQIKYITYIASSKYSKNRQGFNKSINKLDYS